MATVQQAIAQLQTAIGGLSGIKQAPSTAPEKLTQFPFAVAYARSGSVGVQSAGWTKGMHTVVLEIHVARKDLPRDISTAMGYIELVEEALANNPTLGGTVSTIQNPIPYTFGQLDWIGDVKTIGLQFAIEVKIINTL